jgi:hypothetical protein
MKYKRGKTYSTDPKDPNFIDIHSPPPSHPFEREAYNHFKEQPKQNS